MNAHEALKHLDLAAYDLAEAERHERQAKARRMEATKKLAAVSVFFRDGINEIKHSDKNQKPKTN